MGYLPINPKHHAVLGVPIMIFCLDEISDLRQRAAALLTLFPDDRLRMMIQVLEGIAGSLREKNSQ